MEFNAVTCVFMDLMVSDGRRRLVWRLDLLEERIKVVRAPFVDFVSQDAARNEAF